jgi:hypothetical protein
MQVDLRAVLAVLVASVVSLVPVVPVIYYSRLPSLANVFLAAVIYLFAFLTLVPVFKAVDRTDLDILVPILGQVNVLKPATHMVLGYERRLLSIFDPQ